MVCDKMSEKTTERIKLQPYTKKLLDGLKTEENWTFDSVIKSLIYEHEEINDPDTIEDKEKKLRDEYVEIAEYDRVYKENTDNTYKIKELDGKIEETLGEMKEEKEGFIVKLKEQQESYEKLHVAYVEKQKILTVRVEELKTVHKENKDLNHALEQLNTKLSDMNTNLSDIQKSYDECHNRYISFKTRVSEEYITKKQLDTLYQVSVYLSHPLSKRRVFTVSQLYGKLRFCSSGDIEEIIPLLKYKIFPFRKYIVDGVECFGFDKHYLKY